MSGLTKEQALKMLEETIEATFNAKMSEFKEQQSNNMQLILSNMAEMKAANVGKPEKGVAAAQLVRALASCRGNPYEAAKFAKNQFKDVQDTVVKALEASTGSAGGFIVPPEISSDVIELLRPMSAVRRLNPLVVPMDSGTMSMSKLTTGATGGYVGEGNDIGEGQEVFGMVNLSWKKLARLVPISNDLLRFTGGQADNIVRDDLVAALAQREDQAFIRDNGTSGTPKGMRYWAPSGNVTAANSGGTTRLDDVVADLRDLINDLETNDVRMLRPGWMMSPRDKNGLMTVRDANGQFVFRDEMSRGTLLGFPFVATNNIPSNLGSGSDSELYLVDFADAVIGESSELMIDASDQASYISNGSLVSAFSRDQTVIRAIARHDFAMRHDASVAIKTGINYSDV